MLNIATISSFLPKVFMKLNKCAHPEGRGSPYIYSGAPGIFKNKKLTQGFKVALGWAIAKFA